MTSLRLPGCLGKRNVLKNAYDLRASVVTNPPIRKADFHLSSRTICRPAAAVSRRPRRRPVEPSPSISTKTLAHIRVCPMPCMVPCDMPHRTDGQANGRRGRRSGPSRGHVPCVCGREAFSRSPRVYLAIGPHRGGSNINGRIQKQRGADAALLVVGVARVEGLARHLPHLHEDDDADQRERNDDVCLWVARSWGGVVVGWCGGEWYRVVR